MEPAGRVWRWAGSSQRCASAHRETSSPARRSRPRSPCHHEVRVVGKLVPPPPRVQHLELIGAEEQAERPLPGFGAEGGEGVDGPAGAVPG